MHQSTMHLVGLVAALLAATATAVSVPCADVDTVWQDEVAVTGNFPECTSFYDGSKPEKTVEIDAEHPDLKEFTRRRNLFNFIPAKRPGPFKRTEQSTQGNWPPQSPEKREQQSAQGNWPPQSPEKREQQSAQGNWPPTKRADEE